VIVPPLRDRRCEIALLARAFVAEACARRGRPELALTSETMRVQLAYHWPGNVRELRNTIEYVAVAAPDDRVEPSDLPERLGGMAPAPAALVEPEPGAECATAATFRPITDELRELERRRMSEAISASDGVRTQAAQLIDMPIRTFALKVKQYKL
jgi:two-component system response regulator AtoC